MRATSFEFRFRFFVVAVIYGIGFSLRWKHYPLTLGETLAIASGHPSRAGAQVWFGVGGLVVLLAAALRTWATAYLQGDIVHDMNMHSDRLVADGPYRHVRNPLYLGTILLAAGIGVLAPVPSWCSLVAAMTLFNLRLILREEAGLVAAQPEAFLPFKRKVPRLIPAITPRVPASGRSAHWRQAWQAESFMWIFALAQLVFAFTANTMMLLTVMFTTLLAYAVIHVINTHRNKGRFSHPEQR